MDIVKVNAMGENCPIPVVKTKKALDSLKVLSIVEVEVDNEIAVQNINKLVNQKNLTSLVEQLGDNHYIVRITSGDIVIPQVEKEVVNIVEKEEKTIVVLSSDKMGEGDEELGKALIKGFLYATTQLDKLPKTVLLYNGGVKLAAKESDSLQDLKTLEDNGTEILSCGTCLNFYELSEQLGVGKVTNMYSIVEELASATNVIRP